MKALLTFLSFILIAANGLLAQVIDQPVIENVSAPASTSGSNNHDYILNSVAYPHAEDNKDHDPQFQAAPANDNCANAIALTVNAACVAGTTEGATTQAGEKYACQGAPTQSVWYKFVATAATMFAQVEWTSSSGCYFGSAVWSGACVPSTNLSCVSAVSNLFLEVHNLTTLTVGNTYYIQVTYTPGGACGTAGKATTGANFCINVGVPVSCATCATTCGPICVFATTPTVAQVTAGCTEYVLKPGINAGQSLTQCYTFTANSTSFSLQMIINSIGCPVVGGQTENITAFSWTLQASGCGAVLQSGNISAGTMTATALTIGKSYVICYTWTADCGHVNVYPFVVSSAPLPVELIDFRGAFAIDHVELNWATASEINNNYFTVERSSDGITFENIGTVKGAGNSSELINYSFSDAAPLTGVSYYRLKQTDFDGKESYSSAISVNSAGKDFIHIMPNPVKDQLYINVNAGSDDYLSIYVYNLVGQQVYFKNTNVSAGMNRFNLDVSAFSNGVYFLQVDYKDRVVSNLVMKD